LTAFHIAAFPLFDRILIYRSQRPRKSILGIWNPVKHHIPQIWNVINKKPDFDKAEPGKTEPDQTTTKMRILSGAAFG
jgi:hypothetical protein